MAAEKAREKAASLHVLRDLLEGKEAFQAMLIEGEKRSVLCMRKHCCDYAFRVCVCQIQHQSVEDVFWNAL